MSTPYPSPLKARSIGRFAAETLASGGSAAVIGITSRGLFLLTPANRVIFLSYEIWRSPLTVNLEAQPPLLTQVHQGAVATLTPETVEFPEAGIRVDLRGAPLWSAQAPDAAASPPAQRRAALLETAVTVTRQSQSGFSPLLASFLELPGRAALHEEEEHILARVRSLASALQAGDAPAAAGLAAPLLGYGRGLTPSGDDLIAGLLLALARWGQALPSVHPAAGFTDFLLHNAYAHTTALSAAILAAAAHGQADERLVSALDALMTASLPPADAARQLLSYGSSSGIDALLGMALVILD